MPIYEFKCNKCNIIVEKVMSIKDITKLSLRKCTCGGRLEKIMSVPARGWRYMDTYPGYNG